MDYQASTSRKIVIGKKSFTSKLLILFCIVGSYVSCSAQTTTNPLSETVTITAEVLINPGTHPDNPPVPPSPINTSTITDVAIFRGKAYPGSTVSALKNGIVIGSVYVTPSGSFELQVQDLRPGTYSFGIRAEDVNHLTSKLLMFTVYVSTGIATVVDGIFIPPTITSDKVEVKKGSPITFFGMSSPNAEVRLSFFSTDEVLRKTKANASGTWMYKLDSGEFSLGNYIAKGKSVTVDNLSPYSDDLTFAISGKDRLRTKPFDLTGFRKRCDLNNDNRVNLLDFSIMAFWYKRLGFPPKVDLNTDNRVDLTDVSILAYCWTG
jgi:hypothetical protein